METPHHHETIDISQCEILGFFGLVIQCILGLLSFMALLVKRFFENPKRSCLVWALDISKQIFSAALAHCINMALAIVLSGSNQSDNCDWYFITTATDVIIGIFLCYVILMGVERIASYYEIYELNTGVYIRENKMFQIDVENFQPEHQAERFEIDYKIYFIQLIVWGLVVCVAKLIIYLLHLVLAPVLELGTTFLIGWLNAYPNLKLVIIMILIPCIFNAIQFWIQDNILKANKKSNIEFLVNARIARSMTMKPYRIPKLVSEKTARPQRSGSLTSTKKSPFNDI
ncbi:unnamed protein product [Moneuplotes crassus]|uniref:Vacuolar membrane protein n=1 Tax=Euplotes crassus TaxID=5936 RepID=A0AAD1XSE8_EUPCR|nr:unnamed protein product [Moneuplotes crassus]